ncbi:unnamed protein product, partial [Cylicocyclus nassatus]
MCYLLHRVDVLMCKKTSSSRGHKKRPNFVASLGAYCTRFYVPVVFVNSSSLCLF